MGALSRWMVSMHPGKLGGREGCKERLKQHRRVKDGGAMGVRFGGGNRDPEHG